MSFRDLKQIERRYSGTAGELVSSFYVPILRETVRYDRQAGYFDSASLVQIAAGLAAFIQRVRHLPPIPDGKPRMRLVTGATWKPDDLAAYQRGLSALESSLDRTLLTHFEPDPAECDRLGLPAGWRPTDDDIAHNRLGVLAWLVAKGLLEVRVALPLDERGRPYSPGRYGALYHPKSGILYDVDDHSMANLISFQGSVNETGAAWVRNWEKFEVKRSWYSTQDWEDIQAEIGEFEKLWTGREPRLLVLPLPKAVREGLFRFMPPDEPPAHDPLELEPEEELPAWIRSQAQELLEAPLKPGGEQLVLGPLWADGQPLKPFPHQDRVIRRVVEGFPRSFLFCDEVGLGKTIEAGVSLRWLLLRGLVRRVLIIAPRSLVRQWMEELREKAALTAWFYDGDKLQDVGGRVREVSQPLEEPGILIVSRHLVARTDRRDEVLGVSHPWDLVIVDEAHAARQQVFRQGMPNQLLSLLQEIQARRLNGCYWLLTATPMQLDPHEVHDLLKLCGLDDPAWKDWQRLSGFQRFFQRLQVFESDRSVREPVVEMTRVAVSRGAADLDPSRPPNQTWKPFEWRTLVGQLRSRTGLLLSLQKMTVDQAQALVPHLARQTPLAVHMFRHTRATLRAYQERGLVHGLAHRVAEDLPVSFQTDEERELYKRIDELCRKFYRMADLPGAERAGVGFLMAVFRKRLASSFAAFRQSLRKRHKLLQDVLQGLAELDPTWLAAVAAEDDEDGEDADARAEWVQEHARMVRLGQQPQRRAYVEAEEEYLREYIRDLEHIPQDSKFAVFRERLERLVESGQRVILFTQYLDTLDFIRTGLEGRFADRMACYSGRGGEVFDPALNRWKEVEKATVKARCRPEHPHAISILLGTDAASEGLNLQQFSALINYDLPWNPMRVEQRIGRIDRIGQKAAEVLILNIYVRNTIEEDTYVTLRSRIRLFEEVVGPLQPILGAMPRVLRKVAMGEMELAEARRELDAAALQKPDPAAAALDNPIPTDTPGQEQYAAAPPPLGQADLAAWCLAHPAPRMRIIVVPEPGLTAPAAQRTKACLSILWSQAPAHLGIGPMEEILATFDGELADRHPPMAPAQDEEGRMRPGKEGVRLLTWGDPYLTAWLEAVRGDEAA